jgi:hypothetical protein
LDRALVTAFSAVFGRAGRFFTSRPRADVLALGFFRAVGIADSS